MYEYLSFKNAIKAKNMTIMGIFLVPEGLTPYAPYMLTHFGSEGKNAVADKMNDGES